jgi:hypothetical protein
MKSALITLHQLLKTFFHQWHARGMAFLVFGSLAAHAQSGIPLWTNVYTGPTVFKDEASAMALDTNGNVYVTGLSFAGSYDYATICYSSAGAPVWTNRYNGPANGQDYPSAIAVDANGNVYVTGQSMSTNFDYATVAYSSAGVPLWTNRYNGVNNGDDAAVAIAVDKNGNVVITGISYDGTIGSAGPAHSVTIKYSSAGVALWTNRYVESATSLEEPAAVAVDTDGAAVVTGYTVRDFSTADYVTIKYSSAGAPMWTNYYDGQGNDNPSSIAIAPNGNIYVTGSGTKIGSSFLRDNITIAYSSGGMPLWTNRFFGASSNSTDNAASDIAIGAGGNVYVTGYSQPAGNYDYLTMAYSSTGVPLWTKYYNGTGNGVDTATSIALDSSENVYITGYSTGSGSLYDYTSLAYSSNGVVLWTNRFNGPGNDYDYGKAIAVDAGGNAYVTGYARGSDGRDHFTTFKYAGVASTSQIPLTFQISGNRLVLSWTSGAFSLQAAASASDIFSNVPGALSPYTNIISGAQGYFRLKGN